MPLVGLLCTALQCIFIDRGGTEEERNKIVETIMARQIEIEESGQRFNPICIFAEGTTTGGKHLLKFKRGAFQAMRTIQPCFVKLDYCFVNPTFDIVNLLDMLVLMMCSPGLTLATLYIMPPFVPNQYMLDRHNDKGQFDWEVYAWCLRDAMAKAGGFEECEQSIRDKLAYENFMTSRTDSVTYNGKTYYAKEYLSTNGVKETLL
jgi:lysophosphatidylcholine acyltransferase/lyso-PAF acetyltransferase